jgi:hypothetical protein
MLSSSAAAGFSLFLAMLLVAKHRESAMLAVYGASTAVMAAGTVLCVALSPGSEALLVVGALVAGQVTSALVLALHSTPSLAGVRRTAEVGAFASVVLVGVGLGGALANDSRSELAALSAAAAAAVFGWIVSGRRRNFAAA